MKRETISCTTPDTRVLEKAVTVLQNGGVVAFPSDTSYGLAADPQNPTAMERLFLIKGRDTDKAVSCIFRTIDDMKDWAVIGSRGRKILEANLPGPFTFLLEPTAPYPLRDARVGVRIPDCVFTKALSDALFSAHLRAGNHHKYLYAYTATSANVSGQLACYSANEIVQQFIDQQYQPDMILDAGTLVRTPASTVIDISDGKPTILREGAVLPILPNAI